MRTESGLNAGVVHASEYIIQTLLFIGLYTHMHAHHKRTADRPGRRSSGVLHTHRAPETIQRCCQGINPDSEAEDALRKRASVPAYIF